MRQGKDWGSTTEFFRNAIVSAHHLEIKKGGFCSEHIHEHKYNLFYVISGELELTIWRDEKMKDMTVVTAGQTTAIPPGFWHKFRGLTDVQCIEIYQVLLIEPDIERRTQGGFEEWAR